MSLVKEISVLISSKPFSRNRNGWANVVDESFRLGVDLRPFAESLFRIASVSDQVTLDMRYLVRRVYLRISIIAGLAFMSRIMLGTTHAAEKQNWAVDLGFMVLAVSLSLLLVRSFKKSLPHLWTWDAINSGPTREFIDYCEALILDRDFLKLAAVFGADFQSQIRQLFRAETIDGVCRQEERHQLIAGFAIAALRNTSERVQKISLFTPFLELVLFCLLAVGICGIPIVDFLDSDATMPPYTSKYTEESTEESTEEFYDPFQ
jgi:hypothetical protein